MGNGKHNVEEEDVVCLLPEIENNTSIEKQQVSSECGQVDKWMEQLSTPWRNLLDSEDSVWEYKATEQPILPLTVPNEQLASLIDNNWATLNQEQQRKLQTDTLGKDWFHMPAMPSNDMETQKAVKLLHLRRFIFPKNFYKSLGTEKSAHRYYQVGTVLDQPEEFFSNRIPRKERKKTFVEEFLSDPDLTRSTKERYKKIQTEKQKLAKPKKWTKRIQRTLPKWKRK